MLATESSRQEMLHKLSILFVEDDPDVREAMVHFLSRRVGKVHAAPNGESGLSAFKELHPDLVISDIRMGGMDGLAMCQAIREIDADLPVIFVSAHNESEILLSSIDLGVTKFIVKPVDTVHLMNAISEVAGSLDRKRAWTARLQRCGEEEYENESLVNYVSGVVNADRHEELPNIRHLAIPKHGVSGDFYSVADYGNDLYVLLADGAGHGMAAVIPALPLPAVFQKCAQRGFSLLSIAAELNRTLYERHSADHFVAITLLCYRASDAVVDVLNCGNPPACIFSQNGELLHVARSKSTALGLSDSQEFFPELEHFQIEPNSRIYLFTDGLVDTLLPGSFASDEAMLRTLFMHNDSEDMFPVLVNKVGDAILDGRVDDITLLEIQCRMSDALSQRARQPVKPVPQIDPEQVIELGQLSLLYVEDDDTTREYLSAYLNRRMGMVYVARNGEEGLSLFVKYRPEVILADIKMPMMDGLMMAEQIRRLDGDVPIIVTSGSNDIGDAERMFELGVSRFHLKPLDPGKLINTIQICVKQAHALAQLRYSALAFQASSLAVLTADRDRRIVAANPAFSCVTGYALAEVIGHPPTLLSAGQHDSGYFQAMWRALETTGGWSGELSCLHKDGQLVSDWLTANAVKGSNGELMGYNFIFSDITERKQTEERVRLLSMRDGLTQLPNRAMFESRVEECLRQPDKDARRLAIVYINLDRFIEINSTLGVHIGDKVLFAVAQRLLNNTPNVDIVCRMGGDEFAALITCGSDHAIEPAVVELSHLIRQPLQIDGSSIQLRASVGISCYPADGETYEELLKSASTAMSLSRQAGGDTYRFFDKTVGRTEERRIALRRGIRAGLMNGEFYMLYQPKYSLSRQQVVGGEALVRWLHPLYGVISPAEFIPLAESGGVIIEMSEWIIDTVCAQLAEWRQRGLSPVPVSINISPVHFWRGDLVGSLQQGLGKWNLDPVMLPIEVTEGLVMDTSERTLEVLERLKSIGFHISIDDFGTGYSSLKYLKDLPVSELKIDRSFIVQIPDEAGIDDTSRTAIPRAIIQLASEFRLGVVAEGVETENQKNFLKEHGCDVIQGYLYRQPLAAHEFAALLPSAT